MNRNNENDMWDWQNKDFYCLEDNTSIEISKCLLNGANKDEDNLSYVINNPMTPVKACGDLSYHVPVEVTDKEFDQYSEPSSQVKRRRMLQFESEVLNAPFCDDEAFLKSTETKDSLEDTISQMSQWVAGFSEDTSGSNNDFFDSSWIADCLNNADMHLSTEDISRSSGASDVQFDITELCDTPPEYEVNAVKQHLPDHTHGNVVFKGRKSYMRTPPKLGSSVVYPFTLIKPCGALGDMTLNDINQRIHAPPESKKNVSYPTSAFSGKPVVGKTKIRTEGGKGSITIMRTKG
ncbi:hypothetical protein ACJIZ3_017571 [Penstemon smallii]|uniref:Protein XRI1 n=1 Tax=Penstemon smallii TaxID=265156 RepID=A0ABD3SVY1_9LAMI